jgi:hypothetical protein
MNEHRRRILDMLAAGKITADEAEKLISALSDTEAPTAGATTPDAEEPGKYLRVEITKPAQHGLREKNVKIRVPVSILKSGLKLGSLLRFNDDRWGGRWSRLKVGGLDIDTSQFDAAQLDTLLTQVGDVSIDVDNGKATIRVVRE